MITTIRRLHQDEDGAGLVEYALLVALIAMVALSALVMFGEEGGGLLNRSNDCISVAKESHQAGGDC